MIPKTKKHRKGFSWVHALWFMLGIIIFASEVSAQTYEVTIQQRRLGDMIGVEFWIKDVTGDGSAPALGNASLGILYNTDHLQPANLVAATDAFTEMHNPDPTTDSINTDIDVSNPYVTVTSSFISSGNGYNALTAQAVTATSGGITVNAFVLDVNFEAGQSYTGVVPSSTGRGTYIGMLKFDIIDHSNLDCADSMDIIWNPNTFAGDITIEDINGNDMESATNFVDPANTTIRGITVLNPNGPNQAVNRYPDPAYLSLSPNKGYPIYFERSGLEDPASYLYGSSNLAYQLEYSLDGGAGWRTIGRVAESNAHASAMTNKDYNRSGDIDSIDGTNDYFITRADGTPWANAGVAPVGADGYGGILRVIWKNSENFQYRSENAKIQVTQLQPTGASASIASRSLYTDACRIDMSNSTFVLGRLFFVQLDQTGYFRTKNKYSNATQLTVEAWVNLNSVNGSGTEPAIVASASGVASPEEGAWMLYLYDGNRPAFRAREIEGRGPNGYIANVIAPTVDALGTSSDAVPIQSSHADNWTHIAATVDNGTVTLYVNGEIVGQETNTQSVNPRLMTSLFPIWIGVNPNFGITTDKMLHAGIKEVKVWRYALPQDVLRSHIAGVYDPNGSITPLAAVPSDERTSLELYYPLQGSRLDIADDAEYQYGANPLNYFSSTLTNAPATNTAINYRPDRSHIKLTSPIGGEGVSNLKDKVFEVRWAGYGLGKTSPGSEDLQIMVSRDGGASWFDAIDNQTPTAYLLDNVEIESGKAYWEPYNGISTAGAEDDLQGVVPLDNNWSKNCLLKISGTEARGQNDIYDISGTFYVAPYFGLRNNGNSKIYVKGSTALNLTGSNGFVEGWIKPYRFPTTDEEYFPIVAKKSSDGSNLHYALRLLPDGRLEFSVASTTGDAIRTAYSSQINRIVKPNVRDFDSTWVHVGVWFNLANQSQVIFYIDGVPQTDDTLTDQLGTNITVDNLNEYPTYIGTEPISDSETRSFIGEMKGVRFWSGNPANKSNTGSEPTDMTEFIQGALTIRADELKSTGGIDYTQNLQAAFPMDGGSFVNDGYMRSIQGYPASANMVALIENNQNVYYNATYPTIKIVEPVYKQAVPNTKTDLRVRWVGFDYNRNNLTSFRNGSDRINNADLKFGTSGGADVDVVHYQYVASEVYSPSYINAMTLPTIDPAYEFQGTDDKSQYSLELDVSNADPDVNDDGIFNDQGPIKATNTNGRLELKGRSTINGITLEFENGTNGNISTLLSESPLFNITPPSNFTVRVLLEGYHTGLGGAIVSNLGTSYNTKGLKIKLFTNNANKPGTLVDSAESTERYSNASTAMDPANRNAGTNDFADVPFVFTEIDDGRYFVVVDHINHLPIMSRYAANFQYAGDDATTWAIESGWDFQNWDGSATAITESDAAVNPPTIGTKFTAYGYYETDENMAEWASTGLNYNEGQSGAKTGNELAAMVGGDAVKDYQINGKDRTRVRLDAGGSFNRSDITGDGVINATDRQIVDRNNQKVSSLLDLWSGGAPIVQPSSDNNEILPEGAEISMKLLAQAKKYLARGGEKVHNGNMKERRISTQSGELKYKVTAEPSLHGSTIDVPVYIQNEGSDFAIGNATFGIQYDPKLLHFEGLINSQDVLFSDREDLGYAKTYTGPGLETKDPIPALRTIEIDYDAYTELPGQFVPAEKTYLGTLRFSVVTASNIYPFEWHKITVVHTTDGRDVTGDGDFEDITDPEVTFTSVIRIPNGGEAWRSGRMYTITWSKPTIDKPVYIEFSTDNGATWSRITSTPVNLNNEDYNWKTPSVSSTQCLIALIDAETGAMVDKSDAPFSLLPALAAITRPATTDPIYKGGSADFIRWSVEDATDIYFEFSANGEDGWQKVGGNSINSEISSANWVVPKVNSKNAKVRMINRETGEVMAVSESFRILAGSVILKAVSPDNQVKIGEDRPIRWVYDNVSKFDLQFSTDGENWSQIGTDVSAMSQILEWEVPQVKSDKAVIRALWNNDPDMEYSRTPEFKIDGTLGVEELENLGFVFGEPTPNPFRTSTELTFTLPYSQELTIELFTAAGVRVRTLASSQTYGAGNHTLKIDAGKLSSGSYYVSIKGGSFNVAKELVIVK